MDVDRQMGRKEGRRHVRLLNVVVFSGLCWCCLTERHAPGSHGGRGAKGARATFAHRKSFEFDPIKRPVVLVFCPCSPCASCDTCTCRLCTCSSRAKERKKERIKLRKVEGWAYISCIHYEFTLHMLLLFDALDEALYAQDDERDHRFFFV